MSGPTRPEMSRKNAAWLVITALAICFGIWLYFKAQEDNRRAVQLTDYDLCWNQECKAAVSAKLGERISRGL